MAKLKIDFEKLLRPIPETDDGAGRHFEYDYRPIQEARKAVEAPVLLGDEDDRYRTIYTSKPQAADWKKVVKLCEDALARESKDLQVCAWLVEALGRLHGLEGLRDGFDLFRELQEAFWPSAWPKLENGNPDERRYAFDFLNANETVPFLIRNLPLTTDKSGSALSYLRYIEALESDRVLRGNFDSDEERKDWLKDRVDKYKKIFLKQWEVAVDLTQTEFYESAADLARECYRALKKWEASTETLFNNKGPDLTEIDTAFQDYLTLLGTILEQRDSPTAKLLAEAAERARAGQFEDPVSPPDDEESDEDEDEDEDEEPDDSVEDSETETENEPKSGPVHWGPSSPEPSRKGKGRARAGSEGTPPPPTDALEAHRRIVEAAAFLRGNDPNDPVPYLVIRALRAGELFREEEVEPVGPSRETRTTLARLSAEGDWEALLDRAELAMGDQEGRAWLDGQRLALQAMDHEGRSAPLNACKRFLSMLMDAFPGLPERLLDDGTPSANPETLRWLAENLESRPTPVQEPGRIERDSGAEGASEDTEGESPLAATVNGQDVGGSLRKLGEAVSSAPTDRGRFLRRLRLAEFCVEEWLTSMALPILEALAVEIGERRLESWEGTDFCARVARARFICLDRRKRDIPESSLNEAYDWLAKLDPVAALSYHWDVDN